MGFAIAALAGYPAFRVVHADFAVAHIACADIDDAVRQLQRLHQFLRVLDQLFMPAHRLFVIGLADDVLLHFVELVNAEDALCVFPVRASLLAEAGAEGNKS